MLNKNNILVGRSYVNKGARIAREVVEELDGRKVKYNAFDLAAGRPTPVVSQICRKSELARWADREANPEELAKIHPFEQLPWFEEVPPREIRGAELELTRAKLQQVAGNNSIHRW
jgi:hypothetical protein